MKEKINGFLIENAISIFAVGDTVENIFQLHYGVTKCSSNDLFKQLIEYGSVATLNEFCEGQLMPQIFSQGKTKAKSMENLIKFLEDKITDKMSVEEIVDVFEQMCSTPLEEDMVLFETGTFTAFSKEPFFQISLVRQFSNDDEEFYQIHVVILYKPTAENKIFSETTWDEDLDENIFDYIRKSASFAYARNHEYIEIKIYMDET